MRNAVNWMTTFGIGIGLGLGLGLEPFRVEVGARVRARAAHHRPERAEQHVLPLTHVQELRGGVELRRGKWPVEEKEVSIL